MLGTLDDCKKDDWKSYVSPMVHAYNATIHGSTGYSPHYLMFGWHPRLAIDSFLGIQTDEGTKSRSGYVQCLQKRLLFAYNTAAKIVEKTGHRHKTHYDLQARNSTLNIGDRVLVKNVGIRGKHKLANKWERHTYIVKSQPDPDILFME